MHNKKYLSIEEHDRKKLNWKINEAFIKKHNAEFDRKFHTYKTSHNKYSDLNSKEFKSIKGLNANYNLKNNNNSRLDLNKVVGDDLPAEVDWRPLGYVNPIQDQGQCGCCYAFSACGPIEGQLFKNSGTLIKLSEQQILDCSDQYGNAGCNGGTMNNSFYYIQMNGGIETSDSYPYEGQVYILISFNFLMLN